MNLLSCLKKTFRFRKKAPGPRPLGPMAPVAQLPATVMTPYKTAVLAEELPTATPAPAPITAVQPTVAPPPDQPAAMPSAPTTSSAPDSTSCLQALHDRLAQLEKALGQHTAELLSQQQQTLQLAGQQQEAIGIMARNQQALEDQAFRENVLRPLLGDIILTTDSLAAFRKQLAAESTSVPATKLAELLEAVESELLSLLARHGVAPLRLTDAVFDPRRQKAVQVEYVEAQPAAAVLAVVRRGFEWDGKILRPEEVILRRTKQNQKEPT